MTTRSPSDAYSVPQRFGLGAIMAFTTLFAMLLGLLRSYDAPMPVYAFFGAMGATVCAAQMFTRGVPRFISMAAGAICLPLSALLYAFVQGDSNTRLIVSSAPCIAIPGAILGYLMGAIAAGVFLLGDMLEARLRGQQPITAELASEAATAKPVPYYAPDACSPYLGDAAAQLTTTSDSMPTSEDAAPQVKALGPPTSVPVYNCIALLAPRGDDGLIHARAANLSDLRTTGATEREALQHLVGAFKIIVSQSLAEGREVPLLSVPHAARPEEQQRLIAVHL